MPGGPASGTVSTAWKKTSLRRDVREGRRGKEKNEKSKEKNVPESEGQGCGEGVWNKWGEKT